MTGIDFDLVNFEEIEMNLRLRQDFSFFFKKFGEIEVWTLEQVVQEERSGKRDLGLRIICARRERGKLDVG